MLPGWDRVSIMPDLTRRAVKYIEDSAAVPPGMAGATSPRKPFFLYFPLTAPHYPVVPAPEFRGKSKAGEYGDFVVQVDWTVGQVMEAIRRSGQAQNTLVIFTSDNGPEITGEVKPGAYDRIRLYRHYSMGLLRGAKRDAWEGGHRVPFIARWPGKIQPGRSSSETICHVDFMATAAALLGVTLPENAGEDSYNILPALLGQKLDGPIREATVHHSAKGHFAIRKDNWVLIDSATGDDNKEPDWFKKQRGYEPHNQPCELYDLSQDLAERRNLCTARPEKVWELKDLLEKYKQEGRSTPGPPQKNDVPLKGNR
jgi:arylsulfatase A-like enzyme